MSIYFSWCCTHVHNLSPDNAGDSTYLLVVFYSYTSKPNRFMKRFNTFMLEKSFFLSGKPPPALSWWRGSLLIDDTYEISSHLVRNELQLESLSRRELMAEFTCQAANNNVSAPAKTSVALDLNCK